MEIIISIIVTVLITGVFFYINKMNKKKLLYISDELKFFKKEKEYYSEALIIFAKNNSVIFANKAAKDLFSLQKENNAFIFTEEVKLKLSSSLPMDFFEAIEKKAIASEDNFHFKDVLLMVGEESKNANIYIDKSEWNIDNTVTCVIDFPEDIIVTKEEGKIDFLTGLPTQFTSLSEINTLVMKSQRKSEPFALLLMGIDNFSDMQIVLGSNHTNKIIKKISNYFVENPEDNRTVYRMDCDKFLMVITDEDVDNDEIIHEIARDLILNISHYCHEDKYARLTSSVGVVRYPMHGGNATKLLNNVYVALHKAQKESESNIVLFNARTHGIHKDELKMNEEIVKGLKNNEFLLFYQPVYNLKSEEIIGAEALIRWNHPTHGIITPDRFLKVAERTGLIVDIGEYVFNEAMKQRKAWDELGFKKFRITLNLSLREMQVDQLIVKLDRLFEKYEVEPINFNLDIREEDAMANIEKTEVDFKLFKDLGLSISLDNFGAGYSSLKYLQILPLTMIKIDRSLIFDLSSNIDHRIAVQGIIELAHTLGYEVVAEGVETSRESTILAKLNCDHAQGYHFSKPLQVNEFQELLK